MNIKDFRLKLDMSQNEFAKYLEIPVVNIQHWEQGVAKPPKYVFELIKRILFLERGDIFG